MSRIDTKVSVEAVTPKRGKGDKLEIKLTVPYSDKALLDFTKVMMSGEDAEIELTYDDTPLFPEEDEDQMELTEEG